jgi:hypothetical protein
LDRAHQADRTTTPLAALNAVEGFFPPTTRAGCGRGDGAQFNDYDHLA